MSSHPVAVRAYDLFLGPLELLGCTDRLPLVPIFVPKALDRA
jgi:hypothetical protein